MNRGFKFYFKEGLKALKGFLTKKTNIFNYYFYYYVSLLTRMVPFFSPFADLANVKAIRMIRDEHKISISRAFSSTNNPKNYWTLLVSRILKTSIIVAVFALISIVGVLLALSGTGISFLLDFDLFFILPIIFVLPVIVFSAYVSIILPFRSVPNEYIVDFNDKLGATDVVHASFAAFKERGKGTLFLSYFVQSIFADLYLFVNIAIIGVSLFAFYKSDYVLNILIFELTVGVIVAFFVLPLFDIVFSVFRLSLYEDLCAAHVTGPVKVYGVNLRRVDVPTGEVTVNEMLEDLFDAEVVSENSVKKKLTTNTNRVDAFNKASTNTRPVVTTSVKTTKPATKPIVETSNSEPAEPVLEEPVMTEKTSKDVTPVLEELVEEPVLEEIAEESISEEIAEESVLEEIAEEPVLEEIVEEPVLEELVEEVEKPTVKKVVSVTKTAATKVVSVAKPAATKVVSTVKPAATKVVSTVKPVVTKKAQPKPSTVDPFASSIDSIGTNDIFGFGVGTPKTTQPKAKTVVVKTVKKD